MMKATLNKPINPIINPAINTPYTGTPVKGVVLDYDMQYFGKRAIDYSGYGNHGTITGAASVVAYSGRAMSFDGVDDRIVVTGDKIGTGDVTIEAWIKPSGWGGGNFGRVLDTYHFIFSVNSTNSRLQLSSNGYGTVIYSEINSIILSNWYHVVATRKADGKASFYINGNLSGTADQNSGVPVDGSITIIGNRSGLDRAFNGLIAYTRIYNRILTPTEIAYNYKQDAWRYGLPQ